MKPTSRIVICVKIQKAKKCVELAPRVLKACDQSVSSYIDRWFVIAAWDWTPVHQAFLCIGLSSWNNLPINPINIRTLAIDLDHQIFSGCLNLPLFRSVKYPYRHNEVERVNMCERFLQIRCLTFHFS